LPRVPQSPTLPDPEDAVLAGTRHFTPGALRLFLACSRQITLGLAQMLDSLDVGGSTRIAQMLARAGTRIGRETARRYRRAQRLPQPRPEPKVVGPVLRAKYVNHVWLADLTEVRGFLGL